MDSDICRWILEFFLRSNTVPESLLHKTLTSLPLSGADTRLKKTLLLRTLDTLLLKASLSEAALDILELLEKFSDNAVSEVHCRAYCAVAVECTVKYLAAGSAPDDPGGEYAGAVRRVWRERVAALEARRSGLVTGEMRRWRDDVVAAMEEPRVCERLAELNSRREAMGEVRAYLKEAWELMGPSFLESVAAVTKGNGEGGSEFVSWSNRRVNENVVDDDGNDDGDGDGDDACMVDVAMHDDNHGKEQLEERVDANEEVDRCDLPPKRDKVTQKQNSQLKSKHSVLRACNRGVKISSPEEVEEAKSRTKHDPVPSSQVKKVRESLKSSSLELRSLVKDPLPDALHTSEVVRSKLATRDTNIQPPTENQNENVDVPNPNVCKTIVLFQHNDANSGKKSSVHCSNVDEPKLPERNRTARTFEWSDSIDNSPQAIQPRRRKRKWTSLEEETLRAGVKMFGEGNWATIRSFYSNIFESRSGVDLKDKWRNMIR